MRRRQFVTWVGGAALAWPFAAGAQQTPPLVAFLSTRAPQEATEHTAAFLRGLAEGGYVDGRNLAVDYHWAEGRYDRLPSMAADAVKRHPALLVAAGDPAAQAAKAVATDLPLVFIVGQDPVRLGLVASLNRPGGSATGVNFITANLGSKRLELLCELVPGQHRLAMLVNPGYGDDSLPQEAAAAARLLGRELLVLRASTDAEIDRAFAELTRAGAGALVVQADPFFDSRRNQLIGLAARYALPTIYHIREFPASGGLMSYGASLADSYRRLGVYAASVLKGASPAELPILRPTNFELVVNLRTAKALNLTVSPNFLARADEIIE